MKTGEGQGTASEVAHRAGSPEVRKRLKAVVSVGGAERARTEGRCAERGCVRDSERGGPVLDGKTRCVCPGVDDLEESKPMELSI